MMKLKMNRNIAINIDATYFSYNKDSIVELDDCIAKHFIGLGWAEKVCDNIIYVPYTTKVIDVENLLLVKLRHKESGSVHLITDVYPEGYITINNDFISLKEAFDEYEYLDGQVFGYRTKY